MGQTAHLSAPPSRMPVRNVTEEILFRRQARFFAAIAVSALRFLDLQGGVREGAVRLSLEIEKYLFELIKLSND